MKELDEIRQMNWVTDFRVGIVKSPPCDPITAMRKAQPDDLIHYWYWYAKVRGKDYGSMLEVPNSDVPVSVDIGGGVEVRLSRPDSFEVVVHLALKYLRPLKEGS